MAEPKITLDTLTDENVDDGPPFILVYGSEGMGKSSFAAEAPYPVFLRFPGEKIPTGLRPKGWSINNYEAFMDAIAVLYTGSHPYKTLVIDSLTSLEQKVIWPETCRIGDEKGSRANIEAFGYGAGYKLALPIWMEVFDGLESLRRDCGMSVVMTAHSLIKGFKDPENPEHSVYDVALQDAERVSAARFVKQKSDVVLFIKKDINVEKEDPNNKFNKRVLAKGGSTRWIYTEGRPAFAAKSRFNMPEKILYKKGDGFAEIAKYLPAPAEVATKQAA